MGVSGGASNSSTDSKSKTDPWAPAIPYLKQTLSDIGGLQSNGPSGPTAGQTSSFNKLSDLYAAGSPFTEQIGNLAGTTLTGLPSHSDMVTGAYGDVKNALNPYVNGQYLDVASNPYLSSMIDLVGKNAKNAVNAQFAGAGRDLSGINQRAVASGITNAQLPLLFNQFNTQQQNQLAAANQLSGAANNAASTSQNLDQQALAARAAGVPIAQQALASAEWGPQSQYNLEQMFKQIPSQDIASLESLLLPVAGLGGQQSGSSNTTSMNVGFGMSMLSDERYKEDLQQIGTLADGTPIYKFRYKGEDTTRIGVSAQDVEKSNPGAVTEMTPPGSDGESVKYVNMEKATAPSAAMMGGPVSPPGSGMPANGMPMMSPGMGPGGPGVPTEMAANNNQPMNPLLQYLLAQQQQPQAA